MFRLITLTKVINVVALLAVLLVHLQCTFVKIQSFSRWRFEEAMISNPVDISSAIRSKESV